MKSKIKDRTELLKTVRDLKVRGKKIIFTNGCFDLLHIGHIRYLREAKKEGDILVVGLNSDRSVRELKGRDRPLVPQAERAEIVAALEMVDFVTVFDEPTPLSLIREIEPEILVKGGDWEKDDIVGGKEVEERGGRVMAAAEVPGRSTRNLIAEIAARFRSEVEI